MSTCAMIRWPGAKSVGLVLLHPLEGLAALLPGLGRLALPFHRRLLVVRAPLHLLKEAFLEHLLLEGLQGALDLVVEDLDLHADRPLHLGNPEMSGRAMRLKRNRIVYHVHHSEPLP